jgi:hypothetical protein
MADAKLSAGYLKKKALCNMIIQLLLIGGNKRTIPWQKSSG